jgi:hypothetical protein
VTQRQMNWTEVGAAYDRERILAAIETLEWKEWGPGCSFSGMGGMNMAECIIKLGLPRVTEACESHALAPRGFYGMHAHYKNGEVWVYIVDEGVECVPVLTVFDAKDWSLIPKGHPAYTDTRVSASLVTEQKEGPCAV